MTINIQNQDQQITTQIQAILRNPVPKIASFFLSTDAVPPLHPSVPLSRKWTWLASFNAHQEFEQRKR
jgi:hypothetical protein